MTTPLSYDMLEYCSGFTSEQCPEGIVGIAGTTLRIISIEKLGQLFNQTIVPLRYTPRKLVVHPASNYLIIIESDHRAFSKDELSAKFGNVNLISPIFLNSSGY
jgi:splicing factor 3B subunit 3